VYRQAREVLVEQLGIEPGRELQELQRAVLSQDPALAAPTDARNAVPRRRLPMLPNRTIGASTSSARWSSNFDGVGWSP
jgi:hypothetical protein